ncbi:CPXV032 protein [Vaccinia virus]|uniref:Protein OPG030 n=1 Tax=Vaccinia virus TaxID=10245 RepID=A0A2I6J0Y5_VACCV|nr:CPXV032 protein [Vaccinia virus]
MDTYMNRLDLDKLKHENIFSGNIIEDAKEFIFGCRKIYTDSVDDLIELYSLAKYLKNENLKEVVIERMDYVGKYIGKDNWSNIYSFYKENGLRNSFLRQYITNNIEEICNTDQFLKLDVDLVCDILDNDEIVVTRKYTILNMVLRWLENKRVNIDDVTKVMFVIRFKFITYSDLTNAIEQIAPEYRQCLQDLYHMKITRPRHFDN